MMNCIESDLKNRFNDTNYFKPFWKNIQPTTYHDPIEKSI